MTDKAKEDQEKVFAETKSPFKLQDKVKHIANPEFKMVIADFDVRWTNNLFRLAEQIKNPDYPICTYYNIHTNKWDRQTFLYTELELDKE